MWQLLAFLLTVLFPLLANGQTLSKGHCPNHIHAQQHFNFNKYKGVWFEVEKYLFLPEITGKCIYVRYRDLQPDHISFTADIVQIQLGTGKTIPSPSAGKIISLDGSAKINLMVSVLAPLTDIPIAAFKYPYWIIDTDYDDYSIKWACEEFKLITGVFNLQSIWILARTRNYPEGLRHYVHEKLRQLNLHPEFLVLTDQTNCPSPPSDDYMHTPVDIIPPPGPLVPFPLRNLTNVQAGNATDDNAQKDSL